MRPETIGSTKAGSNVIRGPMMSGEALIKKKEMKEKVLIMSWSRGQSCEPSPQTGNLRPYLPATTCLGGRGWFL